ncbi:conserved hypothetical protein [Leishmania mexicana MHOM/GT/2001/U1103]|uniref:Uncharacterized protein n=1 Tax=Leishmania mexicana (strain MHOM/GT/2001/U1103) TaxID=929439 RepID=E9AJV6_LEIMU|nr:conserved hypothetical protein [Leishmania mexicana MHOM/GT/2001/U1103]CBZ23206.1 conserved hypothetical protein [Leishmania mexicana MHOM/GT/2001/U1103]
MSAPKQASKAAAAAVAPSPPSFHVFADLPDHLLCSPDNSVWVYGQYTLSFLTSEAAAQARLERKVQCMMREAQRHYDISCAFFHSLTSEEQMAEVLRVGSGGGALSLPPAMTAATGAPAKSDPKRLTGVHRALRDAWPTRHGPDMSDAANGLAAREVGGAGEGESSENRYSAGLRVNLVLDIVASRKTLRTVPLRSRPYRLAEYLYQFVMQPATTQRAAAAAAGRGDMALHVRSLIIGISDADTTLVGCHVVCPYRHLMSPTPMMMRVRRAIEKAADQERARALAAAEAANTTVSGLDTQCQASSAAVAAEAPASNAAPSPLCSLVASQLARYRRVDALFPAPYARVPPQSLAQIDQSRLILCTPGTLLDG